MLKYHLLIPLIFAALLLSGIASGDDLLGNETQITKLPPDNFHLGLSAGLPFLVGIRGESILARAQDNSPSWAITGDVGLTAGLYASAILERRLSTSPFYAGFGYNYTLLAIAGGSGDVAYGGSSNIHSLLFTISARTTYQKAASVCFTLGAMVQPWYGWDAAIYPMLRISLIRAD
ncbi:MAG: hypothetical protein NTW14_10245 [bacterium]|nr:hypothetical protein [bacterium]